MSASQEQKTNIILDAAIVLFGTRGFHETKISEIADEAGISKGTVYLYFNSKEELFKSTLKRDFERFIDSLHLKLVGKVKLLDLLDCIAEHHLMSIYERREFVCLFTQFPNNDAELGQIFEDFHLSYIAIVHDVLLTANMHPPQLMARAFTGILDGFKMDILLQPTITRENVLTHSKWATRLFLNGSLSTSESV